MTRQMKNRKLYLIINTFLHIICCGLSFYFNNGSKFSISPGNSLLEFFTIHWCAWNALLTVIYNLREINFISQKNSLSSEKRQRSFGLIMAVSNLTSLVGFVWFLSILIEKDKSFSLPMWINSTIWHFLVLPMSLIYFLKFVKFNKKFNLQKKKLFYLILPLPVIFFLANLVRRFILVNEDYFKKANNNIKFEKFAVWWFKHVEKRNYNWLLFWIIFSILYFCLMAYLLIKIKLKFFGQSPNQLYSQKARKSIKK